MTRRPRRADEPYTFAGKEEPLVEIARPEENGLALGPSVGEFRDTALKDSVAAHQAECSCHPEQADGSLTGACCTQVTIARDSTGQPWHIDPLCKVRPEAKA